MDCSYAESARLTCTHCGQPFLAQVWLIVDAAARPDLRARAAEGALHAVSCPRCGGEMAVDAPLLVFRPHPLPPAPSPSPGRRGGGGGGAAAGGGSEVLFSPAQGTSSEQDQQQAAALLDLLRDRLGDAWRDEWREGMQVVPRQMLPQALGADLTGLDRMRSIRDLSGLVQAFINADTWAESQRIVEQHPELLSDEADALLGQWLEDEQVQRTPKVRRTCARPPL